MKFSMKLCALFFIFGVLNSSVYGQEQQESNASKSTFNKYEAFSPLFMNEYANAYHSATGNPGPEYWQNQANYKIKATLDTINHSVKGNVKITYINNSPYKLDFVWLQLDQNTFKKDSRGSALYPATDRNGVHTYTDGYQLNNVKIDSKKANFLVNDTRMQIRFPEPLEAKGEEIEISIDYSFKIPKHGKDRMGRLKTKNGWIYTLHSGIQEWKFLMKLTDGIHYRI